MTMDTTRAEDASDPTEGGTDVRRLAPAIEPSRFASEEERQRLLDRLERYARLLDSSVGIPGTRWRVGLDPIVGLLPGVGDLAGLALSLPILLTAWRLGLPRRTLVRMMGNVGLEAVLGTVPILGDLFDAWYRANQHNVRLIHKAMPAATREGTKLHRASRKAP